MIESNLVYLCNKEFKMKKQESATELNSFSFDKFKKIILQDFKLANESRQASLLGRKEVLTGKAKFGIFGDGKEIAQIALSKVFKNGDFIRRNFPMAGAR